MKGKYIHYCWFGGKPLPKLAKKCIKSWKKYFPDYEIIRWDESNIDVNECLFIKEAYNCKKWAFVADYARTKALKTMGGLYLDTDMIIKKDMSDIIGNSSVLGIEDSNMVNAAIWYEPKPEGYIPSNLLKYYQSQTTFNEYDMYSYSIPRLISKYLFLLGLDSTINKIQKLDKNITVYPREYFYPLSYNYKNNVFTSETRTVHYFDATWLPKWERRENKFIRVLGEKNAIRLIKFLRFSKRSLKKTIKLCLFPIFIKRKYDINHPKHYKGMYEEALKQIPKKKDYVVFVNPEWFGVYNATTELFDGHIIKLGELNSKKEIQNISNQIYINSNIKQVIFSAMCKGWKDLIIDLKSRNKKIKIKTFWHGNHSQVSEPYGWERNEEIFDLHKKGYIDLIGTCKKSLIEFYNNQGYKSFFLTNVVKEDLSNLIDSKYGDGKIHIGLYAAKSDDWRKNMYTQIAAVSLIKNAVIDMVPLNDQAIKFANSLHVPITGIKSSLPRIELIKRMSKNDINLYVTFSECAPMVILESFKVGVPCISGNNHHYFNESDLKNYIVVENESSPIEISKKIKLCLENQNIISKIYSKWEKSNLEDSKNQIKDFLER